MKTELYYLGSIQDRRFDPDELAERNKRRQEEKHKLFRRVRWFSLSLHLSLFALIVALWATPFMTPIRLVVIMFHETSHALAGILTGGQAFGIAVDSAGAGVTLGMGGNQLIILMAGYVGSLLLGILLYSVSAAWPPREAWAVLCVLIASTLTFGWLNDFTGFFGYLCLMVILVGFAVGYESLMVFYMRLVAMTCCLYPILDVAREAFQHKGEGLAVVGYARAQSDVMRFSQLTGIPEGLIATLWAFAGLLAFVILVTWASKKDAEKAIEEGAVIGVPKKKRHYGEYITRPSFPDDIATSNQDW